jgi:hypothetical protein
MAKESVKQVNRNGNKRGMHPNSRKNLKPRWKPGESGNPNGLSITARQKLMMAEVCPFDNKNRTWLDALAEAGMRLALVQASAMANLQDRHEGKVVQPIEAEVRKIEDVKELTDEQLAIIAAEGIIRDNASKNSSRNPAKESSPE